MLGLAAGLRRIDRHAANRILRGNIHDPVLLASVGLRSFPAFLTFVIGAVHKRGHALY